MKNNSFHISKETLNSLRLIGLMRGDIKDVFDNPLATFRSKEGLYISRTRSEYITVYAKYTEVDDTPCVTGAYSHYSRLDCDEPDYIPMEVSGTDSDWECVGCKAQMQNVKNIGGTYGKMRLPPIYGYACPCCGQALLDESLVLGDLASAEKMMSGK